VNSPKSIDTFNELITLTKIDDNRFSARSPKYNWGRVYGGQVVAQALNAAKQTVDPRYHVHSIHAYFIRGGSSDEVIDLEVDRLRDGKSFVTRRVVALQSPGAILNLSASFQIHEDGPKIQERSLPNDLPLPEDLTSDNWSNIMERKVVPEGTLSSGHGVWIRLNGDTEHDQSSYELGLVYASDDAPFDAAARLHPEFDGNWDNDEAPNFFGASLDHAVWFHQKSNPYDWQFHHHVGVTHMGNRGLATGAIYSKSGMHLATVTQEILQRF
jgi:acyl-CoA thioesterase-2